MIVVPSWIEEVECSQPLRDLVSPWGDGVAPRYLTARVLVRLHGVPCGTVSLPLVGGRVSAATLGRAISDALPDELAAHLERDGLAGRPADLAAMPLPAPPAGGCSLMGPLVPEGLPASVVVCTRDRPDDLRRCLKLLLSLGGPRPEIVVVDNAPSSRATRDVVEEIQASAGGGATGEERGEGVQTRIRYIHEPVPGKSRALNRGVAAASGDIVAFTDDDVLVDEWWLDRLLRGFGRAPHVGCVTGCVPSAQLETEGQAHFEVKVGWGADFTPGIVDQGANRPDDPLFPFQPGSLGTGASFAISRQAFRAVGPFDEALGPGTRSGGGEDLDYFCRVLLSGMAIAYEPASIGWHVHRRSDLAIREQMVSYGSGLTAYALKQLLHSDTRWKVLRRLPAASARLAALCGVRTDRAPLPTELRLAEIRGMAKGPIAYLVERRRMASGR